MGWGEGGVGVLCGCCVGEGEVGPNLMFDWWGRGGP